MQMRSLLKSFVFVFFLVCIEGALASEAHEPKQQQAQLKGEGASSESVNEKPSIDVPPRTLQELIAWARSMPIIRSEDPQSVEMQTFKELFDALLKPRGQFETTVQWQSRIEGLHFPRLFILDEPITEAHYDADAQVLSVKFGGPLVADSGNNYDQSGAQHLLAPLYHDKNNNNATIGIVALTAKSERGKIPRVDATGELGYAPEISSYSGICVLDNPWWKLTEVTPERAKELTFVKNTRLRGRFVIDLSQVSSRDIQLAPTPADCNHVGVWLYAKWIGAVFYDAKDSSTLGAILFQ